MRLFIALDIPENLKEKIVNIQKAINSLADVNSVEKGNLHLTLNFIGDVEEKEIENIIKKTENISKQFKKFKIHIKNVGYFGSPNVIRVIWIGCEDGSGRLVEIFNKLEDELSYLREDEFDFNPHLTIGRPKFVENKKKFLEKLEEFKDTDFGEFVVDRIALKQSKLSPKGPIYSDFKVFKLGD